jgi:hypothetical protein
MFLVEVIRSLGTGDDLERDHLVEVLLGDLRQHLGDRGLEESLVAVAVIGADLAEILEPRCFVGRLRVSSVGDVVQIDSLNEALSFARERYDRLDPFRQLSDALSADFGNPNLLFSVVCHLSPYWCGSSSKKRITNSKYNTTIKTLKCQV